MSQRWEISQWGRSVASARGSGHQQGLFYAVPTILCSTQCGNVIIR